MSSTAEEVSSAPPLAPAAGTAADAVPAAAAAKKESKKKAVPEGLVIPPKKPKMNKAERRALQEQQRAAKAGGSGAGGGGGIKTGQPPPPPQQQPSEAPSPSSGVGGGSNPQGTGEEQENNNKQQHSSADAGTTPTAVDSSSSTNVNNAVNNSNNSRIMSLVSHLKVYSDASSLFLEGATLHPQLQNFASDYHSQYALHPAVIRLGYDYATGKIRGGNHRCRAMLACFKTVLLDYIPPNNTSSDNNNKNNNKTIDLRQALDQQVLKPSFQFWTLHCRHHSVSMGNAFTFVKTAVSSLERDLTYPQMREVLLETMQQYADERIDFATQAIADLACTKLLLLLPPPSLPPPSSSSSSPRTSASTASQRGQVGHSEVILTYGYSEVISVLLRQAAERSKAASRNNKNNNSNKATTTSFRVIVVDSRPHLLGRRMLAELRRADIDCTYILLNALTYVLNPQQESSSSGGAGAKRGGGGVTKVLLGAAALMSDGSVLGSIGTACVALCAQDRHVPVLVCCETYKISNRVQLDSLTNNELCSFGGAGGGTHHLRHGSANQNHLHRLNLSYDLTPATFVSGIVTELGIVPPTSVAVLLREMNPQEN
jgi:translation initiation factor eIF-2B subunit delta